MFVVFGEDDGQTTFGRFTLTFTFNNKLHLPNGADGVFECHNQCSIAAGATIISQIIDDLVDSLQSGLRNRLLDPLDRASFSVVCFRLLRQLPLDRSMSSRICRSSWLMRH